MSFGITMLKGAPNSPKIKEHNYFKQFDETLARIIIVLIFRFSELLNNVTGHEVSSSRHRKLKAILANLGGSGTKIINLHKSDPDWVEVRFKPGLGSIDSLNNNIIYWSNRLNKLGITTLSPTVTNGQVCKMDNGGVILVANQASKGVFGSTFRDSQKQYIKLVSNLVYSQIRLKLNKLRRVGRVCAKNGIFTPFDCFCFWYNTDEGDQNLEFGIGDFDYMKDFSKYKHLIYPLILIINRIMVELYILNFIFPKTLAILLSIINNLVVTKLRHQIISD